jgi:hypothetical protein
VKFGQRQMRGASGLLAFGVKGGMAAGVRFIEAACFMSHHPVGHPRRWLRWTDETLGGSLPRHGPSRRLRDVKSSPQVLVEA